MLGVPRVTVGKVAMDRHMWIYALLTLLAVSLGVNAFLFWVVLKPAKPTTSGRAFSLKVGDAVPALEGTTVDGRPSRVEYGKIDARPTVLYVLTPTCSWCRRNARNIQAVVDNDSGRHRFVFVSLHSEGLAELAKTLPRRIELVAEVATDSRKSYFLGATPQTLVISSRGVVLRHWNGAYDRDVGQEVARYFDVTLPGLTEEVQSKALCLDEAGRTYSRGFVALVAGVRKECGENGQWIPATR